MSGWCNRLWKYLCDLSSYKMFSDPVLQSARLSSRGQCNICCAGQTGNEPTGVPTLELPLKHTCPTLDASPLLFHSFMSIWVLNRKGWDGTNLWLLDELIMVESLKLLSDLLSSWSIYNSGNEMAINNTASGLLHPVLGCPEKRDISDKIQWNPTKKSSRSI